MRDKAPREHDSFPGVFGRALGSVVVRAYCLGRKFQSPADGEEGKEVAVQVVGGDPFLVAFTLGTKMDKAGLVVGKKIQEDKDHEPFRWSNVL